MFYKDENNQYITDYPINATDDYEYGSYIDTDYLCNVWKVKGAYSWVNSVFGIAFSNFVSPSFSLSREVGKGHPSVIMYFGSRIFPHRVCGS